MARTSVLNTLERIRRQLSSSHRSEVFALAEDVDISETSIDITPIPGAAIVEGSDISVDLEKMRVTAATAGTLTVIRGWLDSDAATHTNGAPVWANPRFSPIDIFDAMIAEILSWGPHLYRVVATEFALAVDTNVVEAPVAVSDAYDLISVTGRYDDSLTTWPEMNVRLQRGAVGWSGAATSGMLLRFIDGWIGSVFALWSVPFDLSTFTVATDLVADVGLEQSMLDILEMGVKLRLLSDDETAMSARDVQDEPRRAEEVPLTSIPPMLQQLYAIYSRRKTEEVNKLRTRYPYRAG